MGREEEYYTRSTIEITLTLIILFIASTFTLSLFPSSISRRSPNLNNSISQKIEGGGSTHFARLSETSPPSILVTSGEEITSGYIPFIYNNTVSILMHRAYHFKYIIAIQTHSVVKENATCENNSLYTISNTVQNKSSLKIIFK